LAEISVWEAVKIESEHGKLKNFLLLEAVARKWLMKTQQAGKMHSGCCGDL
jgi:hypothetical protein